MSIEDYLEEEEVDDEDATEEGPDPDVLYDQYREARLFGV
jgi:hypothetical protein